MAKNLDTGGGEEILLVGETGVGKEVCAQAVHRRSGRPGELVPVEVVAARKYSLVARDASRDS